MFTPETCPELTALFDQLSQGETPDFLQLMRALSDIAHNAPRPHSSSAPPPGCLQTKALNPEHPRCRNCAC
jgi:hypothetical protein